jgi:hypothetical protein
MPRFGVFDTKDNLWLGDDHGPKTFGIGDALPNGRKVATDDEAFTLARCSAELADIQMGWGNRTKAMAVPEGDDWHIRDEVKPKVSALRALRMKERGVVP